MPSTKVVKTSTIVRDDDGGEREQVQYRITVSRALAEEFDLEGVEWTARSSDRLELTRV